MEALTLTVHCVSAEVSGKEMVVTVVTSKGLRKEGAPDKDAADAESPALLPS